MVGNYRTVMLPTIDVISPDTFEYRRQLHHHIYASRAVFDWTFKYKLVPLHSSTVLHISKPFETPVMAGGLFVITATFFWELGAYDDGLDTYGENELYIENKRISLCLHRKTFCLCLFTSFLRVNRWRTVRIEL